MKRIGSWTSGEKVDTYVPRVGMISNDFGAFVGATHRCRILLVNSIPMVLENCRPIKSKPFFIAPLPCEKSII